MDRNKTNQNKLDLQASRPESLSSSFPFDEVMEKENIFVNRDASLGVIFQVTLAEHEPMTEA